MPCHNEALIAAMWPVPVWSPSPLTEGHTTPGSGLVPSNPGLGYVFSGGATDASKAATVACGDRGADFVLPPGGGVDVALRDFDGAPLNDSANGRVPPDNFYLPGLGHKSALVVVAITSTGHQLLSQLGAGTLAIDGTDSILSCSGPGVVAAAAGAGATVRVVPDETVSVICQKTPLTGGTSTTSRAPASSTTSTAASSVGPTAISTATSAAGL